MLVNTTISEIINEVQGADDSLDVRYDKTDYVRFIEVTDVNVTSVRLSMEKTYDKFVDSVIVTYVNETQTNITYDADEENRVIDDESEW